MSEAPQDLITSKLPWYKKKRFLIPLGSLLLISALTSTAEETVTSNANSSAIQPTNTNTSEEVSQQQDTESIEIQDSSEFGNHPENQNKFLQIIESAKEKIDAAETELQESVALRQRDNDLCAVLNGRTAKNWTGKITEVGANGEGKAHVEIELSDSVRVKTWNNAFSDLSDNTLIPPSASFFDNLVAMSEGTVVEWSGKFLSGKDFCLKKANLTNVFYAIDPQFIVKFSDIRTAKG